MHIVHCRPGEYAGDAARREFGAKAVLGYWHEETRSGHRLVGWVSVRPGDPDLPVWVRVEIVEIASRMQKGEEFK